jgi:serine phosphatase RsbU (regulator of sigma subunit)
MGHYLVTMEGAEPGRHVEVGSDPLTIGRDAKQTLAYSGDSEMSRVHARVSLVNGRVVAEDLGSTNGTFVDSRRIAAPTPLREGTLLRVGRQVFKYERRDPEAVARARELNRDLLKASKYVHSMLPAPIQDGPLRAEWSFVPSAQLGGDAFGYDWLDTDTFIVYLLDVSGHGAGSAMHSVSVMNVLRQRVLPGVDFANPAEVLTSLNDRFQMDTHNGLFFTMWYGVYRPADRSLTYAAAGHHAAYLVPAAGGSADALELPDLMIGAIPGRTYGSTRTTVPAGSRLYLFSDGVFEIVTASEDRWSLPDLVPHLVAPPDAKTTEPDRIYGIVRAAAKPGLLDDDFSLVTVTFR